MHDFSWAVEEWKNGRSAVRKRWDNTAECSVDKSSGQLFNITILGKRIETMRQLDFSDISAEDWMSVNSSSNLLQMSEHVLL